MCLLLCFRVIFLGQAWFVAFPFLFLFIILFENREMENISWEESCLRARKDGEERNAPQSARVSFPRGPIFRCAFMLCSSLPFPLLD
jgi:hypothetical protein